MSEAPYHAMNFIEELDKEKKMGFPHSSDTEQVKEKTIYELDLHESVTFYFKTPDSIWEREIVVTRVPGGWLYGYISAQGSHPVFVPYARHDV